MCGGTCTIHNVIDQDENLDTTEDWITEGEIVENWEYTIAKMNGDLILADDQPSSVLTNTDGKALVEFMINTTPATFDIQESLPSEWILLDIRCFIDETTPISISKDLSTAIAAGVSFDNPEEILSCYFYNKSTPTAVTMISFTANFINDYVLLEWESATEVRNLGFNLYREEAQSGVREKINPELIPSKLPGSIEGALYDFCDDNVNFGDPYAYWLEAIDLSMRVKDSYGPVNVIWWQFFLPIFSVGN